MYSVSVKTPNFNSTRTVYCLHQNNARKSNLPGQTGSTRGDVCQKATFLNLENTNTETMQTKDLSVFNLLQMNTTATSKSIYRTVVNIPFLSHFLTVPLPSDLPD